MGVGAGLSAASGVMNAGAAANSANANAGALEMNAMLNLQNAEQALASGYENERRYRVLSRKALGSVSAAAGASGITMDGSALDVLQESAANAELDALTIRYQGETQARNYRMQSLIESYGAQSARQQGQLGVIGSLLGGAAGAYRNS